MMPLARRTPHFFLAAFLNRDEAQRYFTAPLLDAGGYEAWRRSQI
jgi:hypothetical protein